MDPNQPVGGYGKVNADVAHALYADLLKQHNLVPFKHGVTAAFWNIIGTLNTHLKE